MDTDTGRGTGGISGVGPATFDVYGDATAILYQNEMSISPAGDLMWVGVIYYGIYLFQPSFSFDTTGNTRHVTRVDQHEAMGRREARRRTITGQSG